MIATTRRALAWLRAVDPLLAALRVTLAAGLAATWLHTADRLALLYPGPYAALFGAIGATAVDGCLFVLTMALGRLAAAGERARAIYGGAAALLIIATLLNADGAAAAIANVSADGRPLVGASRYGLDVADWARVLVGGAALPAVVALVAHSYARLRALSAAVAAPAPTAPTTGRRRAHAPRSRRSHHPAPSATGDADQRAALAYLAAHPTATVADAARAIGRPRQTVSRWTRRWREAGAIAGEPGAWRVPSRSGPVALVARQDAPHRDPATGAA